MKHLKFDMLYVHLITCDKNTPEVKRSGEMHPQKAMRELGITYQHATPQPIGDCWWFWNCENIPDNLPPFLTELEVDSMEYVGFGLSQELAERIRDYKLNKLEEI